VREQLPALNRTGFAFEERGEYLDFYLYENVRAKEKIGVKEEGKKTVSP
jgi:hypothetical protein